MMIDDETRTRLRKAARVMVRAARWSRLRGEYGDAAAWLADAARARRESVTGVSE